METKIDKKTGGVPTGGTTGQALVKLSGTDNDYGWGSAPTPSGQTIPMIASEDLTAGIPVGISNLIDDSVSEALTQSLSKALGYTVVNKFDQIFINSTTLVIVFEEATGGNVRAIAATINPNDYSNYYTFGTPVYLDQTIRTIDLCKIGTNRFAVVTTSQQDGQTTQLIVCSVSGNTITVGSGVNPFSTAVLYSASVCEVDTDVLVVSCFSGSNNARSRVVTVSGIVCTLGTVTVQGDAPTASIINTFTTKIDTNKFVLVFRGTTTTKVVAGSISAGTITFGTAIAATGAGIPRCVISPSAGNFVVSFDTPSVYPYTVSGLNVIQGTPILTLDIHSLYAKSPTEIYLYKNGATNGVICKATLGSNILTYNGILIQKIHPITTPVKACHNYFAVGLSTFSCGIAVNSDYDFFVEGMSNQYLGICQDTASKGASVNVLLTGVDSNQSGLITGTLYQVGTSGVLTAVESNYAQATADVILVKAINPTSIKI